ncbi:MAG TPA: efflux RND transporter periplasmic adaptor subunit [Bacteroidales bacterium]|nr:efflux RND transporter periplasmic adaptor subunit [Bacteroidales bacterium]
MKKRLTIIATAVVIVIVILLIILIKPKKSVETEYQTALITKGQIENTVTATGTIEPIIQVEVGTQVSGIIDHIYVDFNSRVKKGEVLAELDKTNLEAELRSSEATLESSKTEFEYQKKNYERSKALYDKKLISDTEYESSKYNYDKAESAFTKANSDIRKVRQNLAYATIYSPIDGVVLDRAVDEGQTVAASFNTPTLFIIANDLTRMQVIANVDEADIGEVKEGQKVTFTVDAFPDDIFNGNVTQVRLQPTTTSNVVTYEVVVDAFNPNYKLKPGLTANITIITMEKEDILMVPVKALRFSPESEQNKETKVSDNSTKRIWIKKSDGALLPVDVITGVSDGIHIEVTGNIKAGDLVVTGLSTSPVKTVSKKSDTGESPFMPARPGQKKK